jgi:citronellol/citronellal dehydrogenase
VNNAGGQFPAPLMAIGKKGFETVLASNLTGGFLMMRELYLQSMQAHGGAIVNMTADMWKGMPGMGHSGAARAGMANLTKTAAVEWAPAACASMPSRRAGSHPAAWTPTRARSAR